MARRHYFLIVFNNLFLDNLYSCVKKLVNIPVHYHLNKFPQNCVLFQDLIHLFIQSKCVPV